MKVPDYKRIGYSYIVPAQQLIIFITEFFGPNPHVSESFVKNKRVKIFLKGCHYMTLRSVLCPCSQLRQNGYYADVITFALIQEPIKQ